MYLTSENHHYSIENPSICPHCHRGIEPIFISSAIGKGGNNSDIFCTVWRCTFKDCKRIFVAEYTVNTPGAAIFTKFLDGTPIEPHFPEIIVKFESKFIKTYMQALQAENLGLDEIAGMGYRKAIEYLVKDYLIQKDQNLEGNIEDLALSNVIDQNFTDSRENDLKDLLKRATWLGNDMTHYLKYHENFDIEDLKNLIKLVMDEIHSIEQKRHYITNLQNKNKK